jgi:hypothetical protein
MLAPLNARPVAAVPLKETVAAAVAVVVVVVVEVPSDVLEVELPPAPQPTRKSIVKIANIFIFITFSYICSHYISL